MRERKSLYLGMRLAPADREKLEALARRNRRSCSEVIRLLIATAPAEIRVPGDLSDKGSIEVQCV